MFLFDVAGTNMCNTSSNTSQLNICGSGCKYNNFCDSNVTKDIAFKLSPPNTIKSVGHIARSLVVNLKAKSTNYKNMPLVFCFYFPKLVLGFVNCFQAL